MELYFAPLEGITGYLYRNAHNTFFHNTDKYFSPFIVPSISGTFKNKDLNDILPENNPGLTLVPQLLTNNSKDFIQTSKKIKELGYQEINLNLGCPSGTVVSKNKGSGFLAKKEELDAFLYEIFSASVTKISIKTRIGKDKPEEFYDLENDPNALNNLINDPAYFDTIANYRKELLTWMKQYESNATDVFEKLCEYNDSRNRYIKEDRVKHM